MRSHFKKSNNMVNPTQTEVSTSSDKTEVLGSEIALVLDCKDEATDDLSEKSKVEQAAGYFELFRFASTFDFVLMFVGVLCAAFNGAAMPVYTILLGDLFDALALSSNVFDSTVPYAIKLAGLGVLALITSTAAHSFWAYTSKKQVSIMRREYLRSVLNQDITWWDTQSPGELTNKLTLDSDQVSTAIGTAVPSCVQYGCQFVTGVIIGFVYGWQLALVILGIVPVLFAVIAVICTLNADYESTDFGKAASVLEECFTYIRTIAAFNTQKKELAHFDAKIEEVQIGGEKKAKSNGLFSGLFLFIMFSAYALAFWFGAQLISWQVINSRTNRPYTGGDVLSTFFSLLFGAFSLAPMSHCLPYFPQGRESGTRILNVIDRKPAISLKAKGFAPRKFSGNVRFQDVSFHYPTRPGSKTLQKVSFDVKTGQTVAFVGESGSGKSTCICLLERFYDPIDGSIIVDESFPLQGLSLSWWREHVGLVSQNSHLFQGTIAENIRIGKPDATMDEVIQAAERANAHGFISALPNKYETYIGGFCAETLSGGEKQRIAIARALIKKPKLLLLDEATSALDFESERQVQEAIEKLLNSENKGERMTCIIIAHRISSTIRNADRILVFSQGQIVEQGTHNDLVSLNGTYSTLLKACGNENENKHEAESHAPDFIVPAEKENSVVRLSYSGSTIIPVPSLDQFGEISHCGLPHIDLQSDQHFEHGDSRVPKFLYSTLIWQNLRPVKWFVIMGAIASAVVGCFEPVFAILMSNMISALYIPDSQRIKHEASKYAWYFFAMACTQMVVYFLQLSQMGIAGERVARKLRYDCFQNLLKQEMAFFDDTSNAPGNLTAQIATNSEKIRQFASNFVGIVIQIVICATVGLFVAFLTNWRLALLLSLFCPFLILSGFGQIVFWDSKNESYEQQESSRIASEAIFGIHTVASFSAQEKVIEKFTLKFESTFRSVFQSGAITGLSKGASEMLEYFSAASGLAYGAFLLDHGLASFHEVVQVFFVIMLSFQNIGRMAEKIPDLKKAYSSAQKLQFLVTRKPQIDPRGENVDFDDEINLLFKEVRFQYPSRNEAAVLKNLDLALLDGKTSAIVGFSGSGKSTILQLLERFYDPDGGCVCVGNNNLSNLNLPNWRSHIGYVGQDPVLFDMSIKENILYGKPDATDDEVLEACKLANVLEFIESLPLGLETNAGTRGGQLSGGQRQRVAIARALIRNPQILLLDEATSALDNVSEKIVMQNLNSKKRTTVIVAHRLSTIQNADQIFVMDAGQVVEHGTHQQLLNLKGTYASLLSIAHQEN
jgi:ATP-binding cassette subfamily B (MDR/TAP) protein 1